MSLTVVTGAKRERMNEREAIRILLLLRIQLMPLVAASPRHTRSPARPISSVAGIISMHCMNMSARQA
jgi:hypothetical protein